VRVCVCAGLQPSWYVQHVVVWDLQADHLFFFLLEDWLSVEKQKNGCVEKEVLASCERIIIFIIVIIIIVVVVIVIIIIAIIVVVIIIAIFIIIVVVIIAIFIIAILLLLLLLHGCVAHPKSGGHVVSPQAPRSSLSSGGSSPPSWRSGWWSATCGCRYGNGRPTAASPGARG